MLSRVLLIPWLAEFVQYTPVRHKAKLERLVTMRLKQERIQTFIIEIRLSGSATTAQHNTFATTLSQISYEAPLV